MKKALFFTFLPYAARADARPLGCSDPGNRLDPGDRPRGSGKRKRPPHKPHGVKWFVDLYQVTAIVIEEKGWLLKRLYLRLSSVLGVWCSAILQLMGRYASPKDESMTLH